MRPATLNQLREVLDGVEEFLDDRADTADGLDGEPLPNAALELVTELREARHNFEREVSALIICNQCQRTMNNYHEWKRHACVRAGA
jgi:hypothetical protein